MASLANILRQIAEPDTQAAEGVRTARQSG